MSFDALVANPGRLQILTALAIEPRQEFVRLRKQTHLTDGNLASHAKRLASAGMIGIEKCIRDGKPVTSFELTTVGRQALESHTRKLLAAISHRRIALPVPGASTSTAVHGPGELVAAATAGTSHEDWVD